MILHDILYMSNLRVEYNYNCMYWILSERLISQKNSAYRIKLRGVKLQNKQWSETKYRLIIIELLN